MTRVAEALDTLASLVGSSPVAEVAQAFESAGFELALVGGPVRDAFLGKPVNDLDFTTSATPDQIENIVRPLADAVWDVGRGPLALSPPSLVRAPLRSPPTGPIATTEPAANPPWSLAPRSTKT